MICPSCYRDVPPGASFCPRCGARLGGPGLPSGERPEPQVAIPPAWDNPWEQRGGRGAVAAFAETLQRVLFHPTPFFRGTDPERGAGAALLYAVIVGTLSIAAVFLWQRALGETVTAHFGGRYFDLLDHRPALAGLSVFLPIGVAIGNLVWAAVLHVSLAVLGGARGTYVTTLKAVCYSSSASAFNVFPICGAALGAIWQVVLQVIGLRELHRTSTGRAFLAWLLPFVVAICLAAAIVGAAMLGLAKFWQHFGMGKFEV